MEFYAYHGHFDIEQKVGNKFIANISIETDCGKAANSDNLEDALDYQIVYSIIKQEMTIASNLLEHVAQRILKKLKTQFPDIKSATLKISKINPPMEGQMEKVSVSLSI